jgi:hypothetical protein
MKTPAVDRKVLRIMAGIVWSLVGLALCAVAIYWIAITDGQRVISGALGMVVGYFVYRFGFSGLARKNRKRIYDQAPGKEKVCLFSFQNWRSYIIIVFMMFLGYTLRHLPISKLYIVPIYLAIGVGLFLSSLTYYLDSLTD